ncbi:MAG: MoaD/ThiS family protein [Candidatus Altiarchaeota archaeon]|nr:MoaD/ThiS family protein [Candidatus Altiarchaeota archaeon]
MVKVVFEGQTKKISTKKNMKIVDILKQLNKNPEEYITVLNGEVVTEFETVKEKDIIKLVRVWSGG